VKINRNLIGKIVKRVKNRLFAVVFFFQVVVQFLSIKFNDRPRFSMSLTDLHLCLFDATPNTGFDRHYVFHTAWASRIVAESRPVVHTDISSSLNFIANVSAFVPVEFYDYRPAKLDLVGVNCHQGDLCALPFDSNSISSLSCMHVVEHIGLGRYGDPLDYDGDVKAINELKRVVAPTGTLLFVVPVGGRSIIKFNAHRIYTYSQVVSMFKGFQLKEFALIPDDQFEGGLIRHATEAMADRQAYGCGCFWFEKEKKDDE
jgi:SAM-dependent methyltransferase